MTKRERMYNKFGGRCAYTGKPLGDDWQIDHVEPKCIYRWFPDKGNPDDESNLVPAIRIVNHYKRGCTLEQFRRYMLTFHIRLRKLPKKTMVPRTEARIKYLNEVAELFGITVDKPFGGKFYFELLTGGTK